MGLFHLIASPHAHLNAKTNFGNQPSNVQCWQSIHNQKLTNHCCVLLCSLLHMHGTLAIQIIQYCHTHVLQSCSTAFLEMWLPPNRDFALHPKHLMVNCAFKCKILPLALRVNCSFKCKILPLTMRVNCSFKCKILPLTMRVNCSFKCMRPAHRTF